MAASLPPPPPKIIPKKFEARKNPMEFVPCDILTDVLSRLPFESVRRFRLVCKQWCLLTYDPYFIGLLEQRLQSKPGILFLNCHQDLQNKPTRVSMTNFQEVVREITTPAPDRGFFMLSNSANGLICVYGRRSRAAYIVNPLTGGFAKLPEIDDEPMQFEYLGLGFDSGSGAYKVLAQMDDNNWAVLTMGTKEWRYKHVGVPLEPWSISHHVGSVLLHGVLYFQKHGRIYSFSVSNEEFGHIMVPSDCSCNGLSLYASSLDSQQSLWYVGTKQVPGKPSVDICVWTLEVNNRTWIPKYSLDRALLMKNMMPVDKLYLTGMPDGKLLVSTFGRFLSCYDPKTKSFKDLYCFYAGFNNCVVYTPCLISPKIIVAMDEAVGTHAQFCLASRIICLGSRIAYAARHILTGAKEVVTTSFLGLLDLLDFSDFLQEVVTLILIFVWSGLLTFLLITFG